MKSFKTTVLILVMATLVVSLAACGSATEDNKDGDKAGGDKALSGSVVVDGSGTVYPFMAFMAEDYMTKKESNVSVEVSRSGTSAGFKKFLVENGTDFNDASREIKDKELATAKELGIEVKEFQVALDGLTFVINPENDWAKELTQQEVINIFLGSAGIKNWSDIRPDFPNQPIKAMGPNENHGTNEFMFENILEKQEFVEGINLQQEYPVLVDLVSKDKYAIAFFGYGYYVNNKDKLAAVKVDFGKGPVEPSLDTIALDGDYAPFTRPVFTYLNVNIAKAKPQVLDYAIYTMKNAQRVAAETGFAPLTDAEIEASVKYLEGLK